VALRLPPLLARELRCSREGLKNADPLARARGTRILGIASSIVPGGFDVPRAVTNSERRRDKAERAEHESRRESRVAGATLLALGRSARAVASNERSFVPLSVEGTELRSCCVGFPK
jgi:hypothetical protein